MVKVALTVEGETSEVMDAIRRLMGSDAATAALPGIETDAVPAALPAAEDPPALLAAMGAPDSPAPVAEPEPEPEVPEGQWTLDHVRTFWDYLAPQAREVYRQVAAGSGYVVSRQSLLDSMGLTARSLSGRLSSQGHAVRRIRRLHNVSLPHPMSFDALADEYKMLPDVADGIFRLNLEP